MKMKMFRSSEQWSLRVLGKVLKAAAFGLVGAVIFGIAVASGYQSEKQASR
jgi:hypothetical protein